MSINNQLFSKQISRRAVLGAAAATTATSAFAEVCPIGPPAHEKGTRVWMDMDQIELDAAYDQGFYAPLASQIVKRYASRSIEARARLGDPKRFSYGSTSVETLDLYPPKSPTRRSLYSYMAALGFGVSPRIMGFRPNFSSMLA
jgi:arylformamidase